MTTRKAIHDLIIKMVSEHTGVSVELMMARGRTDGNAEVYHARQVAMYLLHVSAGVNMKVTGAVLGGRDRTTAKHACDKIEGMRDAPLFDAEMNGLEADIQCAILGMEAKNNEAA